MQTPKILVVYGTTHGQTATIAAFLRIALEQRDCQVTVCNVKEPPMPSLEQFDGIIVGASVIARGHQPAIAEFIRNNIETLNAMPSAFFSVSASAGSSREAGRAAARRLRDNFLAETGFQPDVTECIAGAIKYTKYNFLLRWYMKKASRMNGGSTDTSRDHEYTDWAQVESFAQQFVDLVASNNGRSLDHRGHGGHRGRVPSIRPPFDSVAKMSDVEVGQQSQSAAAQLQTGEQLYLMNRE